MFALQTHWDWKGDVGPESGLGAPSSRVMGWHQRE